MAAYQKTVAGASIEIHDVDHGPPHCHVSGLPGGATARVSLLTMHVTKPPGLKLPRAVAKALKADQEAMLKAWENVISIDRGE